MTSFIFHENGNAVIYLDNKVYNVGKDHPNYNKITECLSKENFKPLSDLLNISKIVSKFFYKSKDIKVQHGLVLYKNVPVHNVLTDKILKFIEQKLPYKPLIRLLNNLMENTSKKSIDTLYPFLAHHGIVITMDGHFLAYKRVNQNYYDFHSGKVKNTVGKYISMDRNKVQDDPNVACSHGYHVGAMEYVKGFNSGIGHIMLVKVNPKDCVSVPKDSNCTKLRVCAYKVIKELKSTDELKEILYEN